MEIYITKYALTKGIIKADCDITSSFSAIYKPEGSDYETFISRAHWCINRQEAVREANLMRDRKIESLEKQINNIRKITF